MNYCSYCGHELAEDAKFCSNCGKAVDSKGTFEQKRTFYEGEIHKCPNCGEILGAFVSVCPSCGYELRGAKSSSTINDFSTKYALLSTEEQKVTFIRNYPVPNTKEDIFEFMILASSSINGEYNDAVFNAWLAKFEQCYQKAKLSFENDSDFIKIQNIYDQTINQVNKERMAHAANKFGTAFSSFTATFPNPVFGIVVVLLGIFEIISFLNGTFSALDIIFVALILGGVYKLTSKK